MATAVSTVGAVNRILLKQGTSSGASVPSSAFYGSSLKKSNLNTSHGRISTGSFKVMAADLDETKQTKADRWAGLGRDISDDQQDITRGKGLVDSLFQAPTGDGTHVAVLSSYEYISQGLREYGMDNTLDGLYIAPAFMDKLVVHIAKNFMSLPNIKVPLILGLWGGKGQGKSFQCELVMRKLGISPIMMSAGELESGNAGEPAKLIRQRYREAADIIAKGKMCCLFINDLDAGAGRMGGTTQYTVNNQMVNATLMNIADAPTNVQLPGMYNKQENARVPIIVTGNDFSTLYAPLIRDGRMEKFYWAPTREDRIGVCTGIFRTDNVKPEDIVKLVDTFPGQSIDFFGALRARVYDDEVRKWVNEIGVEKIGKRLVNSLEGPPTFEQPKITVEKLLEYGNMLVQEQENVKRVQLADKYMSDAALGEASSYHSVKVVEGKGVKRGSNLNSSASSSNLNLVKGQWSKEEDSMLVSLVRQHGVRKWSEIAKELVGRIGKQCRERWHNHLRPDIKKESWTEEEERLLIEAHEKLGNKWAEIAKRIPGRSENSIKNHWNASKRKQNSTRKNKGKSKNGSGSNPSILQEYIKTLSTSPVKTPSIQQSSSHLQFPTTDYPCNPSNAITLMNNQNPNTTFQEGAYYNIQAEIEEPSMDVGGSLDYLNCLESPQQPQLLHGESYADCSDNKDGSYKHTHWDSRICYLLNGGPSPSFEAHQEMDKDSVLEEKDYDSSFLSNRDMDLIEMISSRSSNSNSKRSSSGSCYI